MENIIKFFKETYELDSSIAMDQDDPLVISMQNEFKGLLEKNGYVVKDAYSEYDEYIHSMSFDLDNNKEIRITHDDDGIPCIDIVIDRDIIFTVRPKEEVDLHNFVRDLGNH